MASCGRPSASGPASGDPPVRESPFAIVEVPVVTPTPLPPPADGPAVFAEDLPPEALEIVATGDVNLGGRVGDLIASHGAHYPWTEVAEALRRADLAVVNLECTISRRGAPLAKEFTFRGDPASLGAMAEAGVDVAGLGNNHAADFGREALVDTVEHLRGAGIAPVGAGRDADEAYRPVVVERRGVRVGFVSATRVMPYHFAAGPGLPGVASAYDEPRLTDAVREADRLADVVVVSVHWGDELAPQPDATQVRLGRALVDAGADVVVGHHPHVLQPVVRYRGAVIAYSLGNFVFSSGSPATRTTMLLRVGVLPYGGMVVSRIPVRIEGVRPVPIRV